MHTDFFSIYIYIYSLYAIDYQSLKFLQTFHSAVNHLHEELKIDQCTPSISTNVKLYSIFREYLAKLE